MKVFLEMGGLSGHSAQELSGRMGEPEIVHLFGVPATAAATAIEGKIADPRKYL